MEPLVDVPGEPAAAATAGALPPHCLLLIRLEEAKAHLNNTNRGNATLYANVTGADPRVGNPTIVQQYQDRCTSSRIVLLSMIKTGSNLYNFCAGNAYRFHDE